MSEELSLPQAAQSNDVVGALQKMLMDRIRSPEAIQAAQTKRESTLGEYQEALRAPPMGGYTGTEHSLYSWIAAMPRMNPSAAIATGIASGGDWVKANETGLAKGNVDATKVGYEDARKQDDEALAELKAIGSLSRSGAKALSPQIKIVGNNALVFDPANPNNPRIIHSNFVGPYTKLYEAAYKEAADQRMPNPEAYAHETAITALRSVPGFNALNQGVPAPSGSEPFGNAPRPTVSPTPAAAPAPLKSPSGPAGAGDMPVKEGSLTRTELLENEYKQEGLRYSQATKMGDTQGAQDALRNQALLRQELGKAPSPAPATPAPTPAPAAPVPNSLTYKDERAGKQNEAYGSQEGKDLATERINMNQLSGVAAGSYTTINQLRKIYQDPNLPEGELGPYIQQYRSALKSLGLPTAPSTSAADLAQALATKFALEQRTAGEKNLLPGAMSNYEDQLLQKMAPTLSMTREGRLALLDMMEHMASVNMRLSREASTWAKENENRLTSGWYERKNRVILEEQLKMREKSQRIMSQFGVK